MPGAAVLTLIGTALLVVALAGYLIRVAYILSTVVRNLETVLDAVVDTSKAASPIGEVAGAINRDLAAGQAVIEDVAAKAAEAADSRRAPLPSGGSGSWGS